MLGSFETVDLVLCVLGAAIVGVTQIVDNFNPKYFDRFRAYVIVGAARSNDPCCPRSPRGCMSYAFLLLTGWALLFAGAFNALEQTTKDDTDALKYLVLVSSAVMILFPSFQISADLMYHDRRQSYATEDDPELATSPVSFFLSVLTQGLGHYLFAYMTAWRREANDEAWAYIAATIASIAVAIDSEARHSRRSADFNVFASLLYCPSLVALAFAAAETPTI